MSRLFKLTGRLVMASRPQVPLRVGYKWPWHTTQPKTDQSQQSRNRDKEVKYDIHSHLRSKR